MKRLLLNILLCATLFVGCKDQVLGYDSFEEFIQVNNIQPSQIIYYTTNDGSIVHIDDYIGNAKVILNVYENSRGAIVFDRIITSIGDGAFYDCDGLTSITIPNSVTAIGASAFSNCAGLTTIIIPNGVAEIGAWAFAYCAGLTSITIPKSVTSIGEKAFRDCDGLTSITIPKYVTSIGNFAFYDCDGLTSITIPNSVTAIENSAFYSCDSLRSVTIGNSVTSIGNFAFYDCDGLTSITIPNIVTSIGDDAFYDCDGLTSITIPNSVTSIGSQAFAFCDGLTNVYCKATTPPTLGDSYVFDYNGSGRKIYVPTASVSAYKSASGWSEYASSIVGEGSESGATVQPNYEIWYTSSDGKIVNPNSTSAFDATIISNTYKDGCGVIMFDKEISLIGEGAFYDCDSLTSITIPNSVTSIGNEALAYCSNLTGFTIPNSVTSIGVKAFANCETLKEFKGKFASSDGRCLIVDGVLNSFAPSGLTTYTIPNSVTSIGDRAFFYCTSLTSITIPNSVTTIGKSAFEDCDGLTSVTIPDGVTLIGGYAFYNCDSLTSVTIPYSVTSIGRASFSNSIKLEEFKGKFASSDGRFLMVDGVLNSFAPSGLTTYTIPNSVTSIGNRSFRNCDGLTSITIPNSVTEIGDYAFYDCDDLISVYCKATTPPTLDGINVFLDNGSSRKIYVPTSSVSAYKAASFWSEYASSIVGYDFELGIEVACEIRYTSSNGEIVNPYSTSAFDANIISNTYEDGCGVITFDKEISSIGYRAFEYCDDLTSITIPSSVTSIGEEAFYACSRLTSITIQNSVTSIENWAFANCDGLTRITIPNSVTSIGDWAFGSCEDLTSITIPNSVTSIGDSAFYDCSGLTSVYCKATTPPTLGGSYVFDYNGSGRKIYVPTASVSAYKSASGWSEYASSIVGYDF